MRTWKDLEASFRELEGERSDARLDYQWGAAGEHWRVAAAAVPRLYQPRFEALARIAGAKLSEVPSIASREELSTEQDPAIRWYRALVRLGGTFEYGPFGTQYEDDGTPAGNLYTGSVMHLSEVAANLCVTMESLTVSVAPRLSMLCNLPRYQGPCGHWQECRRLLNSDKPDHAGAIHEAVSAVEGMARLILGDDAITFGDAIKKLRQTGKIHPAVAKTLEGMWGYSSAVPGIRHGSSAPAAFDIKQVDFIIGLAEAAFTLLAALDVRAGL